MDIRFIAVIFLVAALMEMLAKMARKRRGEEELEEREAPRPADPLAGVLEEMRRLSPGDESAREVGPEAPERVVRERRVPAGEVELRVPGSPSEPVVPGRPPSSRDRPAAAPPTPLSPPEQVDEPVTLRSQFERMFEPMPQRPAPPVVVPEPPPPEPVVSRRDRSPRPVEVRSREVRPREARDLAERTWTEERDAPAEVSTVRTDGGRRRMETGWGGEGGALGVGSVRGLRRLVVAREVLGPPLALRGEEPFTER